MGPTISLLSSLKQTAAECTNSDLEVTTASAPPGPADHYADCTTSVATGNVLETRKLVSHRLPLLDTVNSLTYNFSAVYWGETDVPSVENVF